MCDLFHNTVSVIHCQGVRARMVDRDIAPKVPFHLSLPKGEGLCLLPR